MNKYIELVLFENGSSTYLGQVPLTTKEVDAVRLCECDKPGLLKKFAKLGIIDMLRNIMASQDKVTKKDASWTRLDIPERRLV